MKKARSDGLETRRHLLAAASEVFASKGFWEATTGEICRMAGANAAAVNYHFDSKEALYIASWRDSFARSLEAYPADGGVLPDAPAEERLRGRVLSIMHRILDKGSHSFDIVHKEMANPTGLLSDAMQESIGPIREGFAGIIRELLGDDVSEQDVRLCRISIVSQCFGPLLRQRHRQRTPLASHPCTADPPIEDVEVFADHVVRFSLAGIREIRKRRGSAK